MLAPILLQREPYSCRACRCGALMLLDETARRRWRCARCGRSAR